MGGDSDGPDTKTNKINPPGKKGGNNGRGSGVKRRSVSKDAPVPSTLEGEVKQGTLRIEKFNSNFNNINSNLPNKRPETISTKAVRDFEKSRRDEMLTALELRHLPGNDAFEQLYEQVAAPILERRFVDVAALIYGIEGNKRNSPDKDGRGEPAADAKWGSLRLAPETPSGPSLSREAIMTRLGVLRREMDQKPSSEVSRFLSNEVANLLDAIFANDSFDSEARVDLANLFLIAPTKNPATAEGVLQVLPHLRGELERALPPERQEGWYQTLTTIGIRVSVACGTLAAVQANTLSYRYRGIVYYHAVLVAAMADHPTGGVALDTSVQNLAANLGHVRKELSDKDSEKKTALAKIGSELQQIATMSSLEVDPGPDLPRALYARLEIAAALPPGSTPAGEERARGLIADYIDSQAMTSKTADDDLARAYEYAVAAIIRAHRQKHERVASAFFNTGVTLIRVEKLPEVRQKKPEVILARVAMNALGLFWTNHLNLGLERALVDDDGLDCAVNLLGALSTFVQDNTGMFKQIREPAGALVATIMAVKPDFSALQDRFMRMDNSLSSIDRALGMPWNPKREEAQRPDTVEFARKSAALLRALTLMMPEENQNLTFDLTNMEGLVDDSSRLVQGLFAKLVPDPASWFTQFSQNLARSAETAIAFDPQGDHKVRSSLEMLKKVYGEPLGEKQGTLRELGPLVAAEVLSKPEWDEVVAQSSAAPPDVPRAFRQFFGQSANKQA